MKLQPEQEIVLFFCEADLFTLLETLLMPLLLSPVQNEEDKKNVREEKPKAGKEIEDSSTI
jgi:hypothetical protein